MSEFLIGKIGYMLYLIAKTLPELGSDIFTYKESQDGQKEAESHCLLVVLTCDAILWWHVGHAN